MRIHLNIELKKIVRIAKLSGNINVDLIGEFITKKIVEEKLTSALQNQGFIGDLIFDDKKVRIGK